MAKTKRADRTDAKAEAIADLVEKFIAMLESRDHNDDWTPPWRLDANTTSIWAPLNRFTKHYYTGGNAMILAVNAMVKGYTTGLWAPFANWVKAGMADPSAYKPHAANDSTVYVRKGEKGTTILKPNPFDRAPNAAEAAEIAAGRRPRGAVKVNGEWRIKGMYFTTLKVFNLDQIEGYELPEAEPGPEPIEAAATYFDAIVANAPVNLTHNEGGRAFFNFATDEVQVPHLSAMVSAQSYYSTLAHELVHWTGGAERLERKMSRWGTDEYKMEELVAELGAAFQMARLGLASDARGDHLPYIAGYIRGLRANPEILWDVAQDSQRAVDYLGEIANKEVLDLAAREEQAVVVEADDVAAEVAHA